MSNHSSIVGGSTAARVLACPASVVANLNLPKSIVISSEYAEEGVFYHEVMAALLSNRMKFPNGDPEAMAAAWKGEKFHGRFLTQQHIDEGITPALAALAELEGIYGGGFWVKAVEKRVAFPGLPGVFGTIDLVLRNRSVVLHVDFKFGQGVPVFATYPAGDEEEKVNDQLMFYTVAARHTLGKQVYKSGDRLAVAIIQPRIEQKISHTTVTVKDDLFYFQKRLVMAVISALSPDPPIAKGEHCRWAACKPTCKLWAAPLLDAVAFKMPTTPAKADDNYGIHLANAKRLVDAVAILKTEVDNQMHTYLSNGGLVPGWRLKAKAKHRAWVDEIIVDKALRRIGMKPSEIWRKKLLTFEAADAWAKRRRKKIPEHLRVAPPTSDTTIASIDDPAPLVTPSQAIEQFRASFEKLTGTTALLGTTKKD
jgi:hypothetical protein